MSFGRHIELHCSWGESKQTKSTSNNWGLPFSQLFFSPPFPPAVPFLTSLGVAQGAPRGRRRAVWPVTAARKRRGRRRGSAGHCGVPLPAADHFAQGEAMPRGAKVFR